MFDDLPSTAATEPLSDMEMRRLNIFTAIDMGLIEPETAERLLRDIDAEVIHPAKQSNARLAHTHCLSDVCGF